MTGAPSALARALSDRYLIERVLGQGGMATVYLAQDKRHGRRVALKVLRPELAAVIGAERFLAEIKVTANLQHPHILPLHDSGEADSFLFYVMPFVEGESLRGRLGREKQLPLNDAVRIATEVASALHYAHRHDLVHRDIKPENILLHEGQALVADFGIALAVSSAGGTRMTETGMSLGTPHYMSPEQAMGEREISARSDIYALGCVLYEMLTGDPPFTGSTAQAIVARVLTETPRPLIPQRHTIPAHIEDAVFTALEKLPADRFASAAEFADALAGKLPVRTAARPAATTVMQSLQRPKALLRRPVVPWTLLALSGIVLAPFLVLGRSTEPVPRGPVRFSIQLPATDRLQTDRPIVAISPDGRRIAIPAVRSGREQILVRDLARMEVVPLAGTEGGGTPFFSPDGEWVGFVGGGKLKRVRANGGSAINIVDASWGGGSWGSDGTIIYTQSYKSGLWRVNAGGGKGQALTSPDTTAGELGHWWPQFLPGGRYVVFTNFSTPIDRARIELLDLRTGKRKLLVHGGVFGRYLSTGHLAYTGGETMLVVPFDLRKLEVTGSPVPIMGDLAIMPSDGLASFGISEGGDLAYVSASSFNSLTQPMWVGRDGTEQPLLTRPGRYAEPALSPDGRRVSLTVTAAGGNRDVWVYEPARDLLTRITGGDAAEFGARWTPDGRRLIYSSERPVFDLFTRAADASTPETPVLVGSTDKYAQSFSPDGNHLVISLAEGSASDIWLLPLEGQRTPRPLIQNRYYKAHPSLSPNGRWLAFNSDESGSPQVYIQSFPDPSRVRHQISTGGGVEPLWTRGGRELVYRIGDSLLAVSLDPATGETGKAALLFTGPYLHSRFSQSYDVSPDGRRFLMIKAPPDLAPRRIDVVLNWFHEVEDGGH